MNILILSAEPPYPPTHGGARLRLFHVLRQLSSQHSFTLLTLLETPAERDYLPELRRLCANVVGLDVAPMGGRPTLRERFRAPFYRLAHTPEMAAAIRSALASGHHDLVHVDTARMAVYTDELAQQRKLMSAVDCASLAYRNRLAQAGGVVGALRAGLALQTVRAFERKIYREYDACTVVADRDAQVIRGLCPDLPVHVVPNGIDCEAFHPTAHAQTEPGLLLFTGTMDYGPNIGAIVWFVREIFPLIRACVPLARLEVVGRNPTDEVRALAGTAGVRVTGFVAEVPPYLSRASVFVCPLREGAGMKNKMLEAMAAGKAIVTTSEGCSGIGGRDGCDYVIADKPQLFAQAVVDILKTPRRCQALGESARAFVEANYSWERTGRLMHELYLGVAGTART